MAQEPIPEVYEGFPVVTAARMQELDRAAGGKYGLSTLTLMENAGRAVAGEAARFIKEEKGGDPGRARVVICCGRGANGGDGLAAARYLKGMGVEAAVFISPPKKDAAAPGAYPEAVRVNLEKARASGVLIREASESASLEEALAGADLVLDALLGTGSSGKPAGLVRGMIQGITRAKKPVLAVDIPSGLHPDTGYHSGVYVSAEETLALGLPKRGLLAKHARQNVGRLKVLDIGYPKELLLAANQGPGFDSSARA